MNWNHLLRLLTSKGSTLRVMVVLGIKTKEGKRSMNGKLTVADSCGKWSAHSCLALKQGCKGGLFFFRSRITYLFILRTFYVVQETSTTALIVLRKIWLSAA